MRADRAILLTGIVAVAGAAFMLLKQGQPHSIQEANILKASNKLPTEQPKLRQFIKNNIKSTDKLVQDKVGKAQLTLAYSEAKSDFSKARKSFLTIANTYKGTGVMSADFGGIPDQAAYQAAVCLAQTNAEGAKSEFVSFIKLRPLSPLVTAAHRRLVRMAKGRATDEYDSLLQDALDKQQQNIRFETSVCGPKVIEYLLPQLAKPAKDYKQLAKLCGTTDDGTTVEGLLKGLRASDAEAFAYKLNRRDFSNISVPAILMDHDHFLALLHITESAAEVYDPRSNTIQNHVLPDLDDPDFFANVIVFHQPELSK